MKIEALREFVTDEEIKAAKNAIPQGKSKDYYLGFKNALALISQLLFLFGRGEISKQIAAIAINLESAIKGKK